jgi:aminoglycoside phosphotransferase (APT) family kinase protein
LEAIVDWEMGTIGNPKLDLAWLLGSSAENPSVPDRTRPGVKDMPADAVPVGNAGRL